MFANSLIPSIFITGLNTLRIDEDEKVELFLDSCFRLIVNKDEELYSGGSHHPLERIHCAILCHIIKSETLQR